MEILSTRDWEWPSKNHLLVQMCGCFGFYWSAWITEITSVSAANVRHTWKWKVQPVTIPELNGNQYDRWLAKACVYWIPVHIYVHLNAALYCHLSHTYSFFPHNNWNQAWNFVPSWVVAQLIYSAVFCVKLIVQFVCVCVCACVRACIHVFELLAG